MKTAMATPMDMETTMSSEYPVNNDEWMLDHFGYTREELRDRLLDGEDIGGDFDGDPIDLL